MNHLEETIAEINNTIGYYERKKLLCEESIKELKEYRDSLMKKYNLVVE